MKGQYGRILERQINGHHNMATELFRMQSKKNLIAVGKVHPNIFLYSLDISWNFWVISIFLFTY